MNKTRNHMGISFEEYNARPQTTLDDMTSTFSVQQFIQNAINHDPSSVQDILVTPEGQESALWQYEHLRQICQELTFLTVELFEVCSVETCPKMKASEWQYLCAAHAEPLECCAIDYTVHTLDQSCALLNSSKSFPSRVTVAENSMKYLQTIARRLYRIFAHAWYHHKGVFDEFENSTLLFARFDGLCRTYKLIQEDIMIIPKQDIGENKIDEYRQEDTKDDSEDKTSNIEDEEVEVNTE